MERKERSLISLALMQIAAGGSAGFTEICLMHPLDVVKTRFQVKTQHHQYKSIADCFKTMYRTEGALSFYKGILPPVLAETPKRATKFFTFEQYKKIFIFGSGGPTPMTYIFAGLFSGLTEAIVINPFEVVKVRLQTEYQQFSQQKSAYRIAREIIKDQGLGLQGINKGITATLGRHGIWNMVYFGFYHNIKNLFPPAQNPQSDIFRRILIGFTAGTIASIANIPFDVAKSRIQGPQPVPGEIKYKSCMRSIVIVYKEEGVKALYRGLVPKVMRLGPGGAIMLIVFETVYEKLQEIF